MRKFILFCLLALSGRAAIKSEILLEAIALKETGNGWNGQPGPCGELSRWQIMPSVWRQEMGAEPFSAARDEQRARVCALRHLRRLNLHIHAASRRVTVALLATCWHYGANYPLKKTQWGQDVENLYDSLNR